jgi:hypothetical protein
MEIKLKVEKTYDVKYLLASCGARYWEDTEVNGVEDTNGDLIPCREDDYWRPLIDLETGIIQNWEIGKAANVHYKVCDDGEYHLLDESKKKIITIEGYVPEIMCPEGEGYGDYVIMNIDENGKIDNWKASLEEFEQVDNND